MGPPPKSPRSLRRRSERAQQVRPALLRALGSALPCELLPLQVCCNVELLCNKKHTLRLLCAAGAEDGDKSEKKKKKKKRKAGADGDG